MCVCVCVCSPPPDRARLVNARKCVILRVMPSWAVLTDSGRRVACRTTVAWAKLLASATREHGVLIGTCAHHVSIPIVGVHSIRSSAR